MIICEVRYLRFIHIIYHILYMFFQRKYVSLIILNVINTGFILHPVISYDSRPWMDSINNKFFNACQNQDFHYNTSKMKSRNS
jgi:hypothetical protein